MLVDYVTTESQPGYDANGKGPTYWTYKQYVDGFKQKINNAGSYLFTDSYKTNATAAKGAELNDGENFYIVAENQVWTNYPYKTEDGKNFTTPATLVEGHYMFYAPYNENNGTRGPLVATLPVNQDVTKGSTAAVDAFYKGTTPVVVALDYLSAAETSTVNPVPGHLFAYPEFKIVNNYNGFLFDGSTVAKNDKTFISSDVAKSYTMTVKKVEFYTNGVGLFAPVRLVNPSKVWESVQAGTWVLDTSVKNSYQNLAPITDVTKVDTDVADPFAKADNIGLVAVAEEEAAQPKNPAQRIVVEMNEVLEPGDDCTFNVVMPAADYTAAGLYARVFVEIDGTEYCIVTNEVKEVKEGSNNKFVYDEKLTIAGVTAQEDSNNKKTGFATIDSAGLKAYNDYQFADRYDCGTDSLELARGNRYVKAEINRDNTTKKDILGKMLTIELVGGYSQVALAIAPEAPTFGIVDTPGLIDYIKSKPQNNANLEQVDEYEKMDNQRFYLATDNEVVINAALIKALDNANRQGTFTLIENLPIADDVTVKMIDEKTFEFTTVPADAKEKPVSYTISYEGDDLFKVTDTKKLHDGINVVNTDGELIVDTGVENAIVIVNTGKKATVKKPAGIAGIVLEGTAELTVDGSDVAAWIMADDTAALVLKNGNLTSEDSDLGEATITNNGAVKIAVEVDGLVTYESVGFAKTALAKETRVNQVTIKAEQKQTEAYEASQDDFNQYKALTRDVTYLFDANFEAGLLSKDNIKIANAVVVEYKGTSAVAWDAPVKLSKITIEGKNKNAKFVNFYAAGGAKIFTEGKELTGDMVYPEDDVVKAAEAGDVTLGADATATANVVMAEGSTFDGNGFTLTSKNAQGLDVSNGKVVKNVTVVGADRNIYADNLTNDLTLENVIAGSADVGTKWTLNINNSREKTLYAKNSTFYGWSSFAVKEATFEGCTFRTNSAHNVIAPWNTTIFKNCKFEKGLAWYLDDGRITVDGNEVIYLEGCSVVEYDADGKVVEEKAIDLAFMKGSFKITKEQGTYSTWTSDYFSIDIDNTVKNARGPKGFFEAPAGKEAIFQFKAPAK